MLPGLAIEVGLTMASTGGAVIGAYTAMNLFASDQTEKNYKSGLDFLLSDLLKAQQKSLSAAAEREITDLIDRNDTFS